MAFTFSVPDAILSTTLMNYRKTLSDNIFNSIPFYWWLHEKGRKETRSGGESIIEPLLYGANDTVAAYSGFEILDTTPSEAITAAKFAWKQIDFAVWAQAYEDNYLYGCVKNQVKFREAPKGVTVSQAQYYFGKVQRLYGLAERQEKVQSLQ